MKELLSMIAGFAASLGMFFGGLAFAVYLLAVEPQHQPGPSVDVADLWTAEPRKVDTAAQNLERLPAETPAAPERVAEDATAPTPTLATTAVDSFTTGFVQAAAAEDADEEPAQAEFSDELSAAHLEWCADRYRSYRPEDNSYMSYSGVQQPCVSPFTRDMVAGSQDVVAGADSMSPADAESVSTADAESVSPAVAESYPELLEEPVLQYASDGPGVFADDHVSYCFSRYRSYRPEDNSYQPYGGGPRQQCR